MRRSDDDARSRIVELVRADCYRGTALSSTIVGSSESVSELQRQDLVDFWNARYHPDNTLFAIAGKFDWDHVVEQMQTLFGNWTGHAESTPEQRPAPTTNIALEHQEGKQDHLALMSPFPNYLDPDYYAAQLFREVLGGNMASRLFVEVR